MKTNFLILGATALVVSFNALSAQTAPAGSSAPATTPASNTTPATPAPATTPANKQQWDKEHPRRAEVNQRLNNQNARVDTKVAEGKMSQKEADKIHKEDKNIRKEERADAKANGGHITKAEQQKINKQENKVSRQIKNH